MPIGLSSELYTLSASGMRWGLKMSLSPHPTFIYGLGAKPLAKCRFIDPTVKQTGQESWGVLCKMFKFGSFLLSKSVNNICKLLRFVRD